MQQRQADWYPALLDGGLMGHKCYCRQLRSQKIKFFARKRRKVVKKVSGGKGKNLAGKMNIRRLCWCKCSVLGDKMFWTNLPKGIFRETRPCPQPPVTALNLELPTLDLLC